MATPVPGDCDMSDFGDDAQDRGYDPEVVDDDPIGLSQTLGDAGRHMPPPSPPGRRAFATPHRNGRPGRTEYYTIASPPSQRSDRTRTERGTPAGPPKPVHLAPPPRAEPPPAAGTVDKLDLILQEVRASRAEHSAAIGDVVRQQQAQTQAIEELGARAADLESAAAEAKEATTDLARRVAALETRGPAGSSAPPSSSPSTAAADPFFVDRTILRISVRATAPKDEVDNALAPLLRAARIAAADARLDGPGMGRNFVLRAAAGGSKTPEDFVRAVLDAKKCPDGTWRQFSLKIPSGSTLEVHVEADRSIAQRRIGWALSTAAKVCRHLYPQKDFGVAKRDGTITHCWETLVMFLYDKSSATVQATWEEATLARFGMDHAAIASGYAIRVAAADEERRKRRG